MRRTSCKKHNIGYNEETVKQGSVAQLVRAEDS